MDEGSLTNVPPYEAAQRALDAAKYPPTHNYDVNTLTPQGPLREREERILKLFPKFYQAKRFLDVGCSKGYFSLKAAKRSGRVVAMDPDWSVSQRVWPLLPKPLNLTRITCDFESLASSGDNYPRNEPIPPGVVVVGTFDVVWLGNCFHYIHREAEGYSWVERLVSLSTKHIVIEGPRGAGAAGFEGWAQGTVPEVGVWLPALDHFGFKLVDWINSPRYTPGRRIWYLRRDA